MKQISRRAVLTGSTFCILGAGAALAQGRPGTLRKHTATKAAAPTLQSATDHLSDPQVEITVSGGKRFIRSNGIPSHAVGQFPGRGNPNAITPQSYAFEMPTVPSTKAAGAQRGRYLLGVAVNGVPFDPAAAEFWQGERDSGWQYEALGGAIGLGLDANYAHVQPTGAYHYHGMPIGLLQELGWSKSTPSPIIGWAADGFPIYAMNALVGDEVVTMTSSYQLKSGQRPGGAQPSGAYDGAFVQDYQYVEGSGTLDEFNGAFIKNAEFPDGTYAYFLTSSFPFIPRDIRGEIQGSFRKQRGG